MDKMDDSNDDIPHAEMHLAELAMSDAYWERRELFDESGFDWDIARPLAEQWPWGPADPEHMASGDAMLDEAILTDAETTTIITQSSDSYQPYREIDVAPVAQEQSSDETKSVWLGRPEQFATGDAASREPWHTTEETQLSEACDAAVDALDRAETKLRASTDALAELVTEVPDGAA